jgi:NAD(P)-dependent dehydrogenase (short-subunit alcohol dehydrogenase family)
MFELTDRVVVITGAPGNLGRAAAAAFAQAGARLALLHHSTEALREAFEELADDGHLLVGGADQTRPRMVADAVARVVNVYGRIDVLFNTVGGFAAGGGVLSDQWETWQKLYDVNVQTTFHTCRAVAPVMIDGGGGRIVNTASPHAWQAPQGVAAYAAAKAAVLRLTESLAAELGGHGINVNAVVPGTLDTPGNRAAMPDADPAAWVSPRAVADVAVFLASDAARAVRGAAIPVTAGG